MWVLLSAGHLDAPNLLPGVVQLHVYRVDARVMRSHCVAHVSGDPMLLGMKLHKREGEKKKVRKLSEKASKYHMIHPHLSGPWMIKLETLILSKSSSGACHSSAGFKPPEQAQELHEGNSEACNPDQFHLNDGRLQVYQGCDEELYLPISKGCVKAVIIHFESVTFSSQLNIMRSWDERLPVLV